MLLGTVWKQKLAEEFWGSGAGKLETGGTLGCAGYTGDRGNT